MGTETVRDRKCFNSLFELREHSRNFLQLKITNYRFFTILQIHRGIENRVIEAQFSGLLKILGLSM